VADVHDAHTRSRNMAAIRNKNTACELALRSALHREGFRFRLHAKYLPGRPDICFPKYHAVILVHGCFFHVHKCPSFHWPSSHRKFWKTKLEGNAARDVRNETELLKAGWRVGKVWECTIRGANRQNIHATSVLIGRWLRSDSKSLEL
jgi:DNA mismatch endonuclease, patch repair protein